MADRLHPPYSFPISLWWERLRNWYLVPDAFKAEEDVLIAIKESQPSAPKKPQREGFKRSRQRSGRMNSVGTWLQSLPRSPEPQDGSFPTLGLTSSPSPTLSLSHACSRGGSWVLYKCFRTTGHPPGPQINGYVPKGPKIPQVVSTCITREHLWL